MFFINIHLMAGLLSILAFCFSFFTCQFYDVSLLASLRRSLIFAFVFMFIGLGVGRIMKNIVVEAFDAAEAKDADLESEAEENDDTQESSDSELPRI